MGVLHLLTVLLCAYQVHAKAVFAHLLVGNVVGWGIPDWTDAITTAAALKIDAFALNVAYGNDKISTSISYAFQAANALIDEGTDFYLFFSFDYTGGTGPWPASDVETYLAAYTTNGGYYHDPTNGQAFVSTFQGIDNILDWPTFISDYSLEFVPCWSSLGAIDAWSYGVADGLFSWAAWPWGPDNMNTFTDASFIEILGNQSLSSSAPYMMGVSPMFYTNLPGFDKNWVWRGDSLWFDRWQEVFYVQPKFVEIITWNDWGESHYIGPLDSTQYDTVFPTGEAVYNYVEDYPHIGWTALLPAFIDLYKEGSTSFSSEVLVAWARTTPGDLAGCSTNYTTGNTASQLQQEFPPDIVVQDYIFFAALLGSEVDPPQVNIGVDTVPSYWTSLPATYPGLAFGNASFSGYTGDWVVFVTRDEGALEILTVEGGTISDSCDQNVMNYNAWVGSDTNDYGETVTATIKDYVCTAGTSVLDFEGLCQFTCHLGYCPLGACYCTEQGPQVKLPTATSKECYPLEGLAIHQLQSFALILRQLNGMLRDFVSRYGYSDYDEYCGTVDYSPYPTPTISPFNDPYCQAGVGLSEGNFNDMCEWACAYSYCPIAACVCTETTLDLLVFDGDIDESLEAIYTPNPIMPFNDFCTWTCSRGHCDPLCEITKTTGCASGSGDGNYAGLCDFACGRGYCPEPCTCLANGTVSEGATDTEITGYADEGMDPITYGPLCNFTCPRGYCPSPNACLSSFTGNTALTALPALPTIAEYEIPNSNTDNFTAGDFFQYESGDDLDIFTDVLYVGSSSALPSGVCDDVSSGTDADALGCVGETVEWLMLSYLDDATEIAEATTRSVSKYTFNTNDEWTPQPNCSRECQLLANAPVNSWVHVGNGTHNGRLHNLHFMNTGNSLSYKATPVALEANTALEERIIPVLIIGAVLVSAQLASEAWMLRSTERNIIKNNLAKNSAKAAMEAALNGFLLTCQYLISNNTNYMPAGDDPFPMGLSLGDSVGSTVALSAADADSLSTTCTDGTETLPRYIIWPVNGLEVDTINALLATFPLAVPEEHVSVNGDGTMYWTAYLSMLQEIQVTELKECFSVVPMCVNDCEYPVDDEGYGYNGLAVTQAATKFNNATTIASNTTTTPSNTINIPSRIKKRAPVYTTDPAPVPELAFVSQSSTDSARSTYVYDNTAADGVLIYILDCDYFDWTLPEFRTYQDSNGATLFSRAHSNSIGLSGFVATGEASGKDHGTAMLSQAAGGTYGVARNANVSTFTFQWKVSPEYILDALDVIEQDWAANKPKMNAGLAPLAVISMSFNLSPWACSEGFLQKWGAKLNKLSAAGILSVASAGNDGSLVFKYPAAFKAPTDLNYVPDLLVVGAVDNTGVLAAFSDDNTFVELFAPGVGVTAPLSPSGTFTADGTSASTAKTAGVAAYLIGLTALKTTLTSVAALKSYMVTTLAWNRPSSGLPCLYNGAP
ncbi:hypothetical protein BP6252_01689 [Coleophoma cylindrospora]|uniref:Peptidase S8/S53 domain-containing protein n=1 Tax=Coleophoma cylindrospora TaxID=1849047 RepID=A0A3D8STM7_9HELO|nr:hypothetical protein BP6252_01689 [Coleophoma cylindrospora]